MDRPLTRRSALALGAGGLAVFPFTEASGKPAKSREKGAASPEEALKKAADVYLKTAEAAQREYRKAISQAILATDRVEAYLLDFEPVEKSALGKGQGEDKWFPVLPYQTVTKINVHLKLKREQFPEVVSPMSRMVREGIPGGGAACHYPAHGLEFYKGDTLLYFTSLCWHCHNFYVTYPDDSSHWLGFLPDVSGDLQTKLNALLPIPDEVIERFRKKLSEKPK